MVLNLLVGLRDDGKRYLRKHRLHRDFEVVRRFVIDRRKSVIAGTEDKNLIVSTLINRIAQRANQREAIVRYRFKTATTRNSIGQISKIRKSLTYTFVIFLGNTTTLHIGKEVHCVGFLLCELASTLNNKEHTTRSVVLVIDAVAEGITLNWEYGESHRGNLTLIAHLLGAGADSAIDIVGGTSSDTHHIIGVRRDDGVLKLVEVYHCAGCGNHRRHQHCHISCKYLHNLTVICLFKLVVYAKHLVPLCRGDDVDRYRRGGKGYLYVVARTLFERLTERSFFRIGKDVGGIA